MSSKELEQVEDEGFHVPASWEAAVEALREEGPLLVEEWEARAAAARTRLN